MSKLQEVMDRYRSTQSVQLQELPLEQKGQEQEITEQLEQNLSPALTTSSVSESNTVQYSPLQRMVMSWLKQTNLPALPPFVYKLLPKVWSERLQGAFGLMADPEKLHVVVHMMMASMQKGLEEDHNAGYGNESLCASAATTEIGEKGPTGVLSGGDGRREIDTNGNSDSGVSSSVLVTEVTSEDTNL
jgi:hypothetical protein